MKVNGLARDWQCLGATTALPRQLQSFARGEARHGVPRIQSCVKGQ
jgi:hypothetical protein